MNAIPSTHGDPASGISRQVVLPYKKSVQIAFESIRARFFRSMITTMTLVLAVAFLAYVNMGTDVVNGLLQSGDPDIRQRLVLSGFDVGPETTSVTSSPKQRWIAILSILVCGVGIVNAQLMAVTERFREIGTMKCLGALDRFILRLFLLEAGIQGAIGALLGALVGGAVAVMTAMVRFGPLALWALSPDAAVLTLLKAVAVGCILSLAGVFYPALVAARMQPVEAMRSEH